MKYKKGLVSVILPTYNRDKWIGNRINEIINQTYTNWELIIVDDCSTDNTQSICEGYAEEHANIKYIRLEENSGSVTIPRNVGIVNSEGEYIAHTDDDVVSMHTKFEVLVKTIEDSDALLAYGDRVDYYTPESPKYQTMLLSDQLNVRVDLESHILTEQPNAQFYTRPDWNPMEKWGVDGGQFLYRREVYDSIDLLFVRRGCDWELAKKIWEVKEGFAYVENVVSIYIWHTTNRSDAFDKETKEASIYPGNYAKHFIGWDIKEEV